MPVLDNPKQELACQERAKGKTEVEAYELAGYSPNDGNANKFFAKSEIDARVKEITGAVAAQTEVTVASLIEEAEAARILAMGANQASAAVAAIREKGVLSGKRIERAETGRPGDFSKKSDDELASFIKDRASRIGAGVPRVGLAPGSNGVGSKPH